MPTVNWTTNGATLADQCGWSGDGAAHPFVGQFYVDETYNTDSKASAVRLTGAGFSGTINSAILTLGRFNDNTGTNGTLRIRCIAENDPGSLAASGGVAPSARTYRTAFIDYNFPNDAVAVNIDITALIQDLLAAGFTYTGTQKIAIVIAGSSVGGTGWGSNPTVSWRALWLLSTPPTLAITYSASASVYTLTATSASLTTAGQSVTVRRGRRLDATSSTLAATAQSVTVRRGRKINATSASLAVTTQSQGLRATHRVAATSATLACVAGNQTLTHTTGTITPSFVNQTGVAVLYMSTGLDSATTPAITTQAGSAIFAIKCVWQYNTTVEQGPYQQRDRDLITDSFGNEYSLVGSVSTPTNWPSAGEIVQVNRGGTRGSGHTFTAPYALNSELSLIVFEVLNAGVVSNFSIQQLPANGQVNRTFTPTVTCNGKALLIVSGYVDNWELTAGPTPDGWVLIRRYGILNPAKDADIHIVVFAKQVDAGGTYNCPIAVQMYSVDAMCVQTFAIEAIAAGQYTISATPSLVSVSVQSSSIRKSRRVSAIAATIVTAGQTVSARVNRRLSAQSQTVTTAAQAAGLRASKMLDTGSATVAVAPQAQTLRKSRVLSANAANVTTTAQNATLSYGALGHYTLNASPVAFGVTAQNATLLAHRRLGAAAASLVTTGQQVTLTHTTVGHYTLTATPGSLLLSVQFVGLRANRKIAASGASVATVAQSVGLRANRRLGANSAAVTATAQIVDLAWTPAGSHVLTATPGSVGVTAQSAAIRKSNRLYATSATSSISPATAGLYLGHTLTAVPASIATVAQDQSLLRNALIVASNRTITTTWSTIRINYSGTIQAEPWAISTVSSGDGLSITVVFSGSVEQF